MVDENTYETSPIQQPDSGVGSDEPWVPFPPNVTLTVTFPPAAAAIIAGRWPDGYSSSIGLSAQPNEANPTFHRPRGPRGVQSLGPKRLHRLEQHVLRPFCAVRRHLPGFPERCLRFSPAARRVRIAASQGCPSFVSGRPEAPSPALVGSVLRFGRGPAFGRLGCLIVRQRRPEPAETCPTCRRGAPTRRRRARDRGRKPDSPDDARGWPGPVARALGCFARSPIP